MRGLAVVQALEHRELLGIAFDEVGEAQQQLGAIVRVHAAPGGLLECAASGRDGDVDIGGIAVGHARQHLAGRGVHRFECLA